MTSTHGHAERERILAIFQAHRATPGAAYDEAHFLDYLLAVPEKKGGFRDSFSGLRRFNAFIDQVQLEHGVCFSHKDRDADLSLDRFVARVVQLRGSPRSSLASLGNRVKAGHDWHIVALGNLVLGVASALLARHAWALAAALVLLLAFNAACAAFIVREKRYMARLQAAVRQRAGERRQHAVAAAGQEEAT